MADETHGGAPRRGGKRRRMSIQLFTVLALAVAVGLGLAVSPYASPNPDGLEKVAEEKGFLEEGRLAKIQEDAPVPDYAFPGIENEKLATGVAGFVGTLGVFAAGIGLAWMLRRTRRDRTPPPATGAAAA